MPVSAKQRRRGDPATGTVAWEDHDCPETGNPLLRITVATSRGPVAQVYEVEQVTGGYNLYRLDNLYHLITYRIRVDASGCWWCDCPDADMDPSRCNHCKHVRGLRAALAKLPF